MTPAPGERSAARPPILRRLAPDEVPERRGAAVDEATEQAAAAIVARVRSDGADALREFMQRYDGWRPGSPVVFERLQLLAALDQLDRDTRTILERAAERIRAFAHAQRMSLHEVDVAVQGGRAGHRVIPVERAGCYAPAGRFPLPSTVLMTAVTARVAGVADVTVATPKPTPLMLATAALAGASRVLVAGGAHAIAALAWGVAVPACDVIVGPGNRWVTAAKKCVAGHVAIDMLAGPSELLVVADATADARLVAADLLAQAEHDPDAIPLLIASSEAVVEAVETELARQLPDLPTRKIAEPALANGFAMICRDDEAIVAACDRLAPEHLQLSTANADVLAARVRNAGAVFIGEGSAEVFGDYGIGGNHVLPTGGGARFTGGLSVLAFLRVRAWLRVAQPAIVVNEVAELARIEGLEGHARAALARS